MHVAPVVVPATTLRLGPLQFASEWQLSAAMPALSFLALVGFLLIASLLVVNAVLEPPTIVSDNRLAE